MMLGNAADPLGRRLVSTTREGSLCPERRESGFLNLSGRTPHCGETARDTS